VRIVLDTNILVRANPRVSPEGLARELLSTIVFGPHELVLSTWILTEGRRVLNYPHVRKRWPLTAGEMGNYVSALQEAAFLVELPESLPAVVSDPDDDPFCKPLFSVRRTFFARRMQPSTIMRSRTFACLMQYGS
jgi:predicted nucleic acid-binding protein